jgi:type I restriction enzyme S subunit
MKLITVKDLGDVITGNTPPRSMPELYGSHTPFIKATDISENSKYTYMPEECYSEEGYKKYRSSLIPKGATCVVTIGSVGKKMTMAHCDCFINQAMNAVIANDDYDEEYIYYLLKNNIYKLKKLDSGTASGRENVSKSAFSNMELLVVIEKDKQKKIGNILSSFDAQIENNKRQIKLLEEAAQRLYKEWFVDLRFPGYEEVEIVDGVPRGWKKELIGNIIGKVSRTKQVKTTDYLKEGLIPVVDQSRDFVAGYTNDIETVVNQNKPIIVFGDHTRILKYIQFPFAKGADGTQLIISDDGCMPQSLFYLSLIAVDLSNYHYARHFKYLKAESIIVPTQEIANKFDDLVSPVLLEIQKLRDISNKAAEARDRLLPKLMNGEIEV